MNKFTPQQLQEAYKKLPGDIKKLYSSEEVTNKLYNTGQKYNLHVDQIGGLVDEVGWVMVGLNPTQKFTSNIIERLKIDSDLAKNITNDINQEIFVHIREALQKKEESGQPNHDQVLSEIENPSSIKATESKSANIFEQKVSQVFNLPSEKADTKPVKPWEQDPYLERP